MSNWQGETYKEASGNYEALMDQYPDVDEGEIWDLVFQATVSGDMSDYPYDLKDEITKVFTNDGLTMSDEDWDVIWRMTLCCLMLQQWRAKVWEACCALLGEDSSTDLFQGLDDIIINADPWEYFLPAAHVELNVDNEEITLPLFAMGQTALEG